MMPSRATEIDDQGRDDNDATSQPAAPNPGSSRLAAQTPQPGASRVSEGAAFVAWVGHKHGIGTSRRISGSDWRSVGIGGDNSAVWHLGNDFRLPASLFTAEQITYLADVAGHSDKGGTFELLGSDGKPLPR